MIDTKEKEDFVKNLIELSQSVDPKEKLEIIEKDPADNRVLEAAVESNADYIITGDNHLLELKEFKNVKILNADEFLRCQDL